MLDSVKQALRITTDYFDDEIEDLINAAIDDMRLCGIHVEPEIPLCKRAIITYAKWLFGEGDPKMEPIYKEMKAQLKTSSAFGGAYGQKQ